MESNEELIKKIKALEKRLTDQERILKDPSKRGYYALNKILDQQIEYLENFSLKAQIEADPKQDKIYERVTKLWEGLKTMIMDCRSLKQELKITPDDDEKESKKISRTTPEAIADVLNNTAGKVN